MRKFLLSLCAVVALGLNAQTHYSSRVELGVHGGLDLSNVMFTPSVTQGLLPGFNAGVGLRYVEEAHFGFIVEANFAQRGWKEDFDDKPFSYSRTANYVEIPFLAHIYFGRRGRFFINAGPSVSFFLSESTKSNFDYSNVAAIPDFPSRITYQLTMPVNHKVDYGICGGIGGEFCINRRNSIYLDARYYFGLSNMLHSGRQEYIRGSNPMTISVTAGYWFRIK